MNELCTQGRFRRSRAGQGRAGQGRAVQCGIGNRYITVSSECGWWTAAARRKYWDEPGKAAGTSMFSEIKRKIAAGELRKAKKAMEYR